MRTKHKDLCGYIHGILNQWNTTNKDKTKGKDQHKSVHTDDEWKVLIGKRTALPYVTYLSIETIKTKGKQKSYILLWYFSRACNSLTLPKIKI